MVYQTLIILFHILQNALENIYIKTERLLSYNLPNGEILEDI